VDGGLQVDMWSCSYCWHNETQTTVIATVVERAGNNQLVPCTAPVIVEVLVGKTVEQKVLGWMCIAGFDLGHIAGVDWLGDKTTIASVGWVAVGVFFEAEHWLVSSLIVALAGGKMLGALERWV
jgi:hypothetical protein